jgi:Na+/melibiose symporter-like transporter
MNGKDSGKTKPAARQVSTLQMLAYVLPALPLAALGLPIVVHLPQFYASHEIGLSLAMTGAVFSILRLLDVFIDPLMGYWSDRIRTRWGRRRPFVLVGTPILIAGIWMVFVPGGPVSVTYISFWLFVMYLGWSMTTIPHLSWGSELTTDYHERSKVYGWSQFFTIVGMVGVLVVPAVLENAGGYPLSTQIMAMALFAILILAPSIALCVAVLPERPVKLRTHAAIVPTFKFLIKDRALRKVILVDLITSTNGGAIGAMFFFFARYALGVPEWAGTLLLIYFVTGCICIPFWIWLSRRIGKHQALMASFGYSFLTTPMLFLVPHGDFPVASVVFAIVGVNYGAGAFLLRSMMADIADADTAANDAERAGLMYSFLALTNKFGLGWAVGITFGALAWIGFDPKVVNTPDAIEGLRVFFITLPVAFAVLGFWVMRGYPLDETSQQALREDIDRRRDARSADTDPAALGLLEGAAPLNLEGEAKNPPS